MNNALSISVLMMVVFAGTALAKDDAPRRPNIIVIYTDDQGFGDASCLNPEAKFRTPHLDRLAAEGIAFTNAHCSDTVCTPSRYGLLTGRYCWRTVMKTGVLGAEAECLIEDGRMTLASMLRDNDYHTAMVGKWHLGMDFPGDKGSRDWTKPVHDMPLDKGFDYFYGIPASLNYGVLAWFEGRHAKVPPTLFTAKKPNQRHVDYRIMPPYQKTPEETRRVVGKLGMEVAPDFIDNQCLTRFTDKAIDWMQARATDAKSGRPFFLYLPYTSPHYPVCPLPEFHGKGECGGYGEFVIETDHHVGRILSFLKESGLDDDTLIVFSSDNGPENSWRQRIKEFDHYSSGPYRGGKRDIYEGGHRVPFFVRWPSGIKAPGRSWDGLIGQTDLLATLAEIIGADIPDTAGEDSQSFASILSDPSSDHERLPLISHGARGRFAITDGHWKLIMPHRRTKAGAELYDLSSDSGESKDVIREQPDLAASLRQKITDIVCNGRTTPGDAVPNDTGYWGDLAWITPAEYQRRTAQARLWKKHVVVPEANSMINSAVANDFDRDGAINILSSYDGQVVLLRGPDWKPQTVHVFDTANSRNKPRTSCIHSCLMDVDGDGDLDFCGSNNTVFWLECPDDPLANEPWTYRTIDDEILGTHCLITGDVNRDGRVDLIANSGRPAGKTEIPDSLTWLEVPKDPHSAKNWIRHVFADRDAPGGSHYTGFGDINGDGRPDISCAAKGGDGFPGGEWFAWWEQPADASAVWKKHVLSARQPGATNIHPIDANADGHIDFIATRGHGRGVLWFKGPRFQPIEIDSEIEGPHCLATVDLDNDGDSDIATCGRDADGLAVWYENSGKGEFTRHLIGKDQGSYDIRAVDMDGDKDLDLLIAGHTSRNIVWYENSTR